MPIKRLNTAMFRKLTSGTSALMVNYSLRKKSQLESNANHILNTNSLLSNKMYWYK